MCHPTPNYKKVVPLFRRRLILDVIEDAQPLRQFKNGGCYPNLSSRRHTHSLHVFFIFLAAFLTLAGVDPAASASLFRSPSFLNDVSYNAAVSRYK
jgi:hypothetical protein